MFILADWYFIQNCIMIYLWPYLTLLLEPLCFTDGVSFRPQVDHWSQQKVSKDQRIWWSNDWCSSHQHTLSFCWSAGETSSTVLLQRRYALYSGRSQPSFCDFYLCIFLPTEIWHMLCFYNNVKEACGWLSISFQCNWDK